MRRPALAFLLIPCFAAALSAGGWAAVLVPRYHDAYRLLSDVAAGPDAAGRPAAARRASLWEVRGVRGAGDLYLPDGPPRAKLLIVPGLAVEGKDHPQMIAFAESFARAGFAVLVPDLANLRALRASAEDVPAIVAAAVHLARLEVEGLREGRIAIAAISYAVGPAVLAALDHRGAEVIDLVISVGGYADTLETITYVTTGATRGADGAWVAGVPNTYGRWAFVWANAQRLPRRADREALGAIAERKFADPAAPFDDLARGLSAEGQAVLALVTNSNPDAVPGLVAALPAAIGRDIAALDLARADLSALRAEMVLIHGADDTIIPAAQSRRLAGLLPPGLAHLAIVDHLMHVEFQQGLSFDDALTLLEAGARIIAFRDR